jgi:hypothetical protein
MSKSNGFYREEKRIKKVVQNKDTKYRHDYLQSSEEDEEDLYTGYEDSEEE